MKKKPYSRFKAFIPDAALLALILFYGCVYTLGLQDCIDIVLYDETSYLRRGVSLKTVGFPNPQQAPFYAVWYYILSLAEPDRIDLFYSNVKLVTILPSLALFLFFRVNKVSRIASLLGSLVFLFSAANFPVWPKVCHFALFLLVSGLVVASCFRGRIMKVLAAAFTVLLVSYTRPEFFLSFIILGLLYAFMVFKSIHGKRGLPGASGHVVFVLACLSLIGYWGSPIGSGSRDMWAFAQHYSLRWVEWSNDSRNPWADWRDIIVNDFGDATTPIEAVKNNPPAVMKHVSSNLKDLQATFKSRFMNYYPRNYQLALVLNIALILVLVEKIFTVRGYPLNKITRRIRRDITQHSFMMALAAVILLPSLLSLSLIYPRDHYILIPGVICLAFTWLVLMRETSKTHRRFGNYLTVLTIIALSLTLHPMTEHIRCRQPDLDAIKSLRTLELGGKITVLEAGGGYGVYVSENYTVIPHYNKISDFSIFLNKKNIGLILWSNKLGEDTRYKFDPEWEDFTKAPHQWDFTCMNISNVSKFRVCVRESILTE